MALWLHRVVTLLLAGLVSSTWTHWVCLNSACSSCAETTSWAEVTLDWVKSLKVSCKSFSNGSSSNPSIPKVNLTVVLFSGSRLFDHIWSYARKYNEEKVVCALNVSLILHRNIQKPSLDFWFLWLRFHSQTLVMLYLIWLYWLVVCSFWYHLTPRLSGYSLKPLHDSQLEGSGM